MRFNLDDYEPVEERIERFYTDHKDGRITTELVRRESGEWVFRAEVYRHGEDQPWGTGYAHEIDGQGNVNKTSACENCETSAIGRALANAGYAAKRKRPTREEMAKVQRGAQPKPNSPGDAARQELRAACEQYGWNPQKVAVDFIAKYGKTVVEADAEQVREFTAALREEVAA